MSLFLTVPSPANFLSLPAEIISVPLDLAKILHSFPPSLPRFLLSELCGSLTVTLLHLCWHIILYLLDLQIYLTAYFLRASAIYNKCLSFLQHLIQSLLHSSVVLGLKLRSSIMCALTSGKTRSAANDLITSSPSHCASMSEVPYPTALLIMGPVTVPAYPWDMGFSSPSAHGIAPTSQSHPRVATKGQLTLLLLQSLPPTVPAHSLSSQVQIPGALHGTAMFSAPRLWVSVTNKLLSVSSVQGWVCYV